MLIYSWKMLRYGLTMVYRFNCILSGSELDCIVLKSAHLCHISVAPGVALVDVGLARLPSRHLNIDIRNVSMSVK